MGAGVDRDLDRILDEYLAAQAVAGSRAAVVQLAERWTPRLLRHAGRVLHDPELARDAVQETWATALPTLRRLRDPARFPAWILGIASRRCVDLVRRAARARRLGEGLAAESPSPAGPDPDLALDLNAALARLPADQRLAASLFYGEGLDLEAVAEAIGASPAAVKGRLRLAREALKPLLSQGDAR